MGTERTLARQPSPPERRQAAAAPAPAVVSRVTAPAATQRDVLQRRLGAHGLASLLASQSRTERDEDKRARDRAIPAIQCASLTVSSPTDAAEREATKVGAKVARMAMPAAKSDASSSATVARETMARETVARETASLQVQRRHRTEGGEVASPVASEIHSRMSGGSSLPAPVRGFMEPRFNADFGGVRIHTDEKSAELNQQVHAKAFTVGSHVFFGKDAYQPGSQGGKELIAHELTHTIQQGAVAQRADAASVQRAASSVTEQSPPKVQRLGISDLLDYAAEKAYNIPGYRMFTVILGVNPINMERVPRTAANVIRAVVEFMPGGKMITDALDNHGIIDKVGGWVSDQLDTLGMIGGAFKQAFSKFIDSLSWTDIFDLGDVWERAKRIFTDPIDRVINFVKGLVTGVIKFIKDAILMPIAKLAENTRGWPLLIAVLGKNPITDEPVPRTAETLIPGFLKLIGQEEVWENMKKAKAIPRVWAWFQGALSGVLKFVMQLPTVFVNAFKSLELMDIVVVPRAFAKVAGVFGGFILDFITWAGNMLWTLLELIFEVVSPKALQYIKKTGGALKSILKNPLPFMGNLVKAAKRGFGNFADNIGEHLKTGLIDWLTGSLPGVYIPKAFELGELVKFVFSVLGISWANIRQKLVKVVGETAVKAMETGFDIVVTLVTQGPAAAWDKIKDQLTNLKDTVIGGITDFVVSTIVKKAVPKLIAMFIPGAGFVSAIISIYETIMVFVNRISTIIQVVTGFLDSIVAIAGGAIDAAAAKVEKILASLLSLAINFLAGFLGLGKVADKIMGVIGKVRGVVDKAIDALINWIVTTAKKLFSKVFGKEDKDKAKDAPPEATVQKGFSLPNESHTVTAQVSGANVRVKIASDRELEILAMLADAKAEVAADDTRDKADKSKVLGILEGARERVKSMEHDWNEASDQKQDFKVWVEIRLAQIVNLLDDMGAHGIKAFRDFKGTKLDKRYLPAAFDVRQKLYLNGSGWSGNRASVKSAGHAETLADVMEVINNRTSAPAVADAAWNRLVKGDRVPDGATKDSLKKKDFDNTKYEVDHRETLSIHWESQGGNNTGDKARWDLSDTSKLRYITERENLARKRGSYVPFVGKGFTSVIADGGQDYAKRIDGQPFLDAPGGKPI